MFQVTEKLGFVARDLKQLHSLKDLSNTIGRLQKEADKASQEVDQLERSLSTTGSTKTIDDVQNELNRVTSDMLVTSFPSITICYINIDFSRKTDRESNALSNEAERQKHLIRDIENNVHTMELEERDLLSKLNERDRLEKDIKRMDDEILQYIGQSKVLLRLVYIFQHSLKTDDRKSTAASPKLKRQSMHYKKPINSSNEI